MSKRKHVTPHDDIITSSKHPKITTDNAPPIIDDVLFIIMTFLPSKFLFRTLTRVSRQFNKVAHLVPAKFEAYGVSRFIPFLSDRSIPIHLDQLIARFDKGDNLDTFRAFLKCPGLYHLKSLVLEREFHDIVGLPIDNEVCEILSRTESLSHLEKLEFLWGCLFDHVGMGYLVNSPHLGRVKVLTVQSSEFTRANVLTHSPMMSQLTSCTSRYCNFSEFDLDKELPQLRTLALEAIYVCTLKCMPHLDKCTNLTCLVLHGVGNLQCKLVAESPLYQLEDLTLTGNVGDEGLKYIASSPYLKNLKYLNLAFSPFGDTGLTYLSKSENMANLKYLNINSYNIREDGIQALSSSQYFSNLEHLEVIGSSTLCGVCELIAHSPHLTHLKKLSLNSQTPRESLPILCSNLHLTHLYFGNSMLPYESCQVLAHIPQLVNLQVLKLSVSKEGFEMLDNSSYLINLRKLSVEMSNVEDVLSIISNSKTFCKMSVTVKNGLYKRFHVLRK